MVLCFAIFFRFGLQITLDFFFKDLIVKNVRKLYVFHSK